MSTIAAGTTIGTALVNTGDTTGTLQLQVNGTTPALTLNTAQAVGVGSSPAYGTSGQVLTSQGSAAAPVWATPSTGSMTLISTQTASGTTVDFTGLSGYNHYMLMFDNLKPSNSSFVIMQLGTGATTWITGYSYYMEDAYQSGNGPSVGQQYSNYIAWTLAGAGNGVYTAAGTLGANGTYFIHGMINGGDASYEGQAISKTGSIAYNINFERNGGSLDSNTTAKTAIRILTDSGGGFSGGKVSLYGIS